MQYRHIAALVTNDEKLINSAAPGTTEMHYIWVTNSGCEASSTEACTRHFPRYLELPC